MKKLFGFLSMIAIASVMMLSATSCEEKEPSYGLSSLSVTTVSGQSYNFTVDQTNLTVDNTSDPVSFLTQEADLKNCTVTFAATLDAVVTYNGATAAGTLTGIDMTSPIRLTVSIDKWSKVYTVTLVKGEVSSDMKQGVRMSSNISATGIPSNLTDYDVVYLNGKFYMTTCGYNGPVGDATEGTGYYEVYSSINGVTWQKVSSNLSTVGAVGARAVVVNNKAYVIGGCRAWGNDVDGNAPEYELSWGMVSYTVHALRVYETGDFTSVNQISDLEFSNAEGTTPSIVGSLKGSAPVNYNIVTAHNGKIFWKSGLYMTYGQLQQNINSIISSSDGKSWTEVLPADNYSRMHNQTAFFSFKNKLWMVGGFSNFVAAKNVKTSIASSSDDGLTWTESTTEFPIQIFGAKVVVNNSGTTAYLFGGVTYEGEALATNAKVYKTTDGETWSEVTVNSNYTGRKSPAVVVDNNNVAWVFGREAASVGTYGYTGVVDNVKANALYDVWAFALDE